MKLNTLRIYFSVLLMALVYSATASATASAAKEADASSKKENQENLSFEGEKHLTNIKQLTFGGQNAEAYFSSDGSRLIFQASVGDQKCDAIYQMNVDGSDVQLLSSGQGVTTCAYFSPDSKTIIYASTHLVDSVCPPRPDHSRGYVWALYEGYDIFAADPDGSNLRHLTDSPGYDAECVYSPAGDKIIFTSARDGDLELYTMNPDGSDQKRITNQPGYDGGAFFSRDGKKIVWRASRPTGDDLTDYQNLLAEGLIRPSKLDIYIADADGSNIKRLTDNGKANFGPYWSPGGKFIIFASNMNDPKGRNFDLYSVDIDTREVKQITFNPTFDGFPMFTYDGKKLVFASNRNNQIPHETNIFIADWVE